LIDKTAVIEIDVKLGSDVSIGKYSIIKSGTTLGNGVSIGSFNIIGSNPETLKSTKKSGLIIKDGTQITDYISINLGTERDTIIGQNCFIMNNSYIAHDTNIGDRVLITSSVVIGGYVKVGDEAYIGMNSSIHQNSSIGKVVCLGANSFAKGNLVDGLVYTGIPAKPLKINKLGINSSKLEPNEIEKIISRANNLIQKLS